MTHSLGRSVELCLQDPKLDGAQIALALNIGLLVGIHQLMNVSSVTLWSPSSAMTASCFTASYLILLPDLRHQRGSAKISLIGGLAARDGGPMSCQSQRVRDRGRLRPIGRLKQPWARCARSDVCRRLGTRRTGRAARPAPISQAILVEAVSRMGRALQNVQ